MIRKLIAKSLSQGTGSKKEVNFFGLIPTFFIANIFALLNHNWKTSFEIDQYIGRYLGFTNISVSVKNSQLYQP